VRRAALAPASIAVGLGLVLGGWWWVRNLVVNGAIQPTAVVYPQPGPRPFSDSQWLARMMRVMSEQFFVPFYGTGMYTSLARVLIVLGWAVILVCCLAWIVGRRRSERFAVAEAGLLAMPVVAPLTMVLWSTYSWWLAYFRFVGVGARYMLPGTVAAAALIAGGAGLLARGHTRLLALLSLLLVAGAHLWGTLADLRKFFGPPDASYKHWWLAMLDWAPIPARVTEGLPVLIALFLAATLAGICLHRPDTEKRSIVRLNITGSLDEGVTTRV
jgi:hypothetical protein